MAFHHRDGSSLEIHRLWDGCLLRRHHGDGLPQIDGANAWQRIRFITLPTLKPTVIILFLFAIGGILKGNFGLFYNLVGNNSMLFKTTDIIETYVYRSMMNSFNFSQSSAVGLFQSVVGFFIVLGANAFVKRLDPDYALF